MRIGSTLQSRSLPFFFIVIMDVWDFLALISTFADCFGVCGMWILFFFFSFFGTSKFNPQHCFSSSWPICHVVHIFVCWLQKIYFLLFSQSFLYQLCKGVAHCHSHGVLHRLQILVIPFNFFGFPVCRYLAFLWIILLFQLAKLLMSWDLMYQRSEASKSFGGQRERDAENCRSWAW